MPLLEREHILDSLAEYARSADVRDGRLVLISGEAGVGKSSLVERHRELTPDARWAWGGCDGLFTPRPLGPLFDIAEQLGGALCDACVTGADRDELFARLVRTLQDPGRGVARTVLAIEDVQWADEATLDLLGYLGRRVRDLPVLVLVTYRDDALAPDHPLRLLLGDLAAQRSTRRATVSPLSEGAVRILAEGSDLEPAHLHRLTGGNPFFVAEVVRGGADDVPTSARDAVLARLARLSGPARRVVEAAALIGGTLEPVLLGTVAGAGPAELDELVDAGVLVSDGPSLRFRHEITRMAVERDIAAHRRQSVHVAALAALQARGCEDDARLAYHADGAENGVAVLCFAARAAQRAARLAAHREAADQYDRALRFADSEPNAKRAVLFDALAREAALIDRWDRSRVASEQALALWREVGDRHREGDVMAVLARTMWRLCRGADALTFAHQAVRTLEPLGSSPELARAYAMLAAVHMSVDPAFSLELVRKALAVAVELQLPAVQSDALNTEACILAQWEGEWESRMRMALEIAVTAGLPDQAGRAYANLHAMFQNRQQHAMADEVYRDGVRYCEDNDLGTYGYCLRGAQAEMDLWRGRWDDATDLAQPLLDSGQTSPANRVGLAMTVGLVALRRGSDDGGSLAEALQLALGSDDPDWALLVCPAEAERLWLAGDPAAARVALEPAVDALPVADGWSAGRLLTWCRRLEVTLPEPAVPLAEPYAAWLAGDVEAAVALWDELGCPFEAALVRLDSATEDGLRDALRRFDDLGAHATTQAVRREMKRAGIRSIPAGAQAATRDHPLGLTRRESEVLDLLCAGHSNAAISERLFISTRTAGHHVSAVLAKLGVPSRAGAVVEATRLGLASVGPN